MNGPEGVVFTYSRIQKCGEHGDARVNPSVATIFRFRPAPSSGSEFEEGGRERTRDRTNHNRREMARLVRLENLRDLVRRFIENDKSDRQRSLIRASAKKLLYLVRKFGTRHTSSLLPQRV